MLPWCEISDDTIKNAGEKEDAVSNAMIHYLRDDSPQVSEVKLNSGDSLRLGLGQLAVIGFGHGGYACVRPSEGFMQRKPTIICI